MPEIKEVMTEAAPSNISEEVDLLPTKIKPAEASSGTLPADETKMSAEGTEGEVAPDFGQGEILEEGKSNNTNESAELHDGKLDIVTTNKEEAKDSSESGNIAHAEGDLPPAEGNICEEDLSEANEPTEELTGQEASPAECESQESKQASPEESKSEEAMEVINNVVKGEASSQVVDNVIKEASSQVVDNVVKEEASSQVVDNVVSEEDSTKLSEETKTEEVMEVVDNVVKEEVSSQIVDNVKEEDSTKLPEETKTEEVMEVVDNKALEESTSNQKNEEAMDIDDNAQKVDAAADGFKKADSENGRCVEQKIPEKASDSQNEEMSVKSGEESTSCNGEEIVQNSDTVEKPLLGKGCIESNKSSPLEGTETNNKSSSNISESNDASNVTKETKVEVVNDNIKKGTTTISPEHNNVTNDNSASDPSPESICATIVEDKPEVKNSENKADNIENIEIHEKDKILGNTDTSESKENGEPNMTEKHSEKEIDTETVNLINILYRDGKAALLVGEFFSAADILGKCCEEARKVYDELDVKCVEYYYNYGCAMLECARNENAVLGEKMKPKDDEEENEEDVDDEENEDDKEENVETNEELEENGSGDAESMAVDDENIDAEVENSHKDEPKNNLNGGQEVGTSVNGEAENGEEEEDTSLRVAWEMFELSKVIYQRNDKDKELADTYMKLGEVGIESGHATAMNDMLMGLDIRKKLHSEISRIVAETNFHIGLAYASFQLFDEAIQFFGKAKDILNLKLETLSKLDTKEAADEMKEIKELIPDLDEKIQDMKESKEEKIKKDELEKQNGEGSAAASTGSSSDKPASNIGHLVKRKRKLEDVASDLLPNSKQPCTEKVSETTPTSDSIN